jgi:uncharacterized membrane protein YfcA
MGIAELLFACFLFFVIAVLYSSVGHAGSSGYLAMMALLSFAPETIKPTSLILNIIVATIASIKYIKEGCYDKKILLPFIISSIPMAFLGGYISLNPKYFKLVAGLFLVISALLLLIRAIWSWNRSSYRHNFWSYWRWWWHFLIAHHYLCKLDNCEEGIRSGSVVYFM